MTHPKPLSQAYAERMDLSYNPEYTLGGFEISRSEDFHHGARKQIEQLEPLTLAVCKVLEAIEAYNTYAKQPMFVHDLDALRAELERKNK